MNYLINENLDENKKISYLLKKKMKQNLMKLMKKIIISILKQNFMKLVLKVYSEILMV